MREVESQTCWFESTFERLFENVFVYDISQAI